MKKKTTTNPLWGGRFTETASKSVQDYTSSIDIDKRLYKEDIAGSLAYALGLKEAKDLGFDGKGCIHPRQIQPIHEEFAPNEIDVKQAKKIVLAFDKAKLKGLGVVSLGSKMIDPPVVKRAQQTINLALQMDLLPKNWKKS